jgi:uncharacterized SAM-binding protein YcdF (DUF218 family)
MRRLLAFALLAVAVGMAVYLGWVTIQIHNQSTRDESRAADVIIILGAAEYRGRPSPVLKARIEHGLELWQRRLAPHILTTGGAGGDPHFTEGEVARDYLVQQGVPSEEIIVESEGGSTFESTAAAAEIMRRMGLKSCILVSDGYHIFRAKKMLEFRGIEVYGSPRPAGAKPDGWWLFVRQAIGYALWRVGVNI